MTWTLHPITRFADFAPQWDALARSRAGTPFLESAFLQPALQTFGDGNELLCMELAASGQLRSAAIVQRGNKGAWQTFQPSQLPLGAWIADADTAFAPSLHGLLRQLPGLALGLGATQLDSRLQTRPPDGPTLRTQDYIQTSWVDINCSFDAYWESRGKNLKQNTRKQRNKLKTEGTETTLECITAPADVAQAMLDYGRLESAGWKASDGTAVHPDNAQGRFYREMLENLCAIGRGRIYRYRFGDKVVAMDLCIHDDTAIVILKTTYDESYKTVSPSTLMRQDEFQQLFDERRFERIEFFGKVMEWHTRWTDNTRAVYHANVYRHALVLRLLGLRERLRKPAAATTPPGTTQEAPNA
jgi:CelD/BcsL family acetyltransferase involved in cellulose biosynthesis